METLYNQCVETVNNGNSEDFKKRREEIQKKRKANRNKTKEERDAERQARWEQAYKEAFDLISNDAENKITEAAEMGYYSVNIYRYKKSDNVRVNGVYISNCLTKGTTMDLLREHFKPFTVYHRRINKEEGKETSVVCVSWKQNDDKDENQTK